MSDPAEIYARLTTELERKTPLAVATVVSGDPLGAKLLVLPDEILGSLGSPALDAAAIADARAQLEAERSITRTYSGPEGEVDVFLQVFPTPPTLLIFGAVHVAQPLSVFAKHLGFEVIVSDARTKLATEERFPDVDRIIQAWPDEALADLPVAPNWYIAILTHDPKFDEPALIGALETPARYIGAVGSRKTNIDRRRRLTEAGVSPEDLARVRGPIGLDIGASTPAEMAVSILGEIIAERHGRTGAALTGKAGPIRGDAEPVAAR
ncbi:MAG: XdhC family protein [Thermomicrobiales bacterium]|nr:XdhC family protein [Thermomicrobiales bacterium]